MGCVYELVTWKGKARIKISQDLPNVTTPGGKRVYRLVDVVDNRLRTT
jgi:nicotinic acid phosphoribosyltransferase